MRMLYGVMVLVGAAGVMFRIATMFLMMEHQVLTAVLKKPLLDISWLTESAITVVTLMGMVIFTAMFVSSIREKT